MFMVYDSIKKMFFQKKKNIKEYVECLFSPEQREVANTFFAKYMVNGTHMTVDCRTNAICSTEDFYLKASFAFESQPRSFDNKVLLCYDIYSTNSFIYQEKLTGKIYCFSNDISLFLEDNFMDFIISVATHDTEFRKKIEGWFENITSPPPKKASYDDKSSAVFMEEFFKIAEKKASDLSFDFMSPAEPGITQNTFFCRSYFSFDFPPEPIKGSNDWLIIGSGFGDEDEGGTENCLVVNKLSGEIGYADIILWFYIRDKNKNFTEYVTHISSDIVEFIRALEKCDALINGKQILPQ